MTVISEKELAGWIYKYFDEVKKIPETHRWKYRDKIGPAGPVTTGPVGLRSVRIPEGRAKEDEAGNLYQLQTQYRKHDGSYDL